MYLLDTCILSALLRPKDNPGVMQFLESTKEEELYISTVTLGEIEYGIHILPDGKRKANLREWTDRTLKLFKKRLVPFHEEAALMWGEIRAAGKKIGRTVPVVDAQIAACAKSSGFTLVTRNVKDFYGMGVEILNPWDD